MFNNQAFNQACPGGNIASQIHPYSPEELEHDDELEVCEGCGELAEECRCMDKVNEDDPAEDR